MRQDAIPAVTESIEALYFGRVDLGGVPYIRHLMHVASIAEKLTGSKTVGLLGLCHDLLEDDLCTSEELLHVTEDQSFVDNVVRLTRQPGEHRTSYIRRVLEDESAAVVKYVDLCDNSNLYRLNKPATPKDIARVKIYARDMATIATRGPGICQEPNFRKRVISLYSETYQLPAQLTLLGV